MMWEALQAEQLVPDAVVTLELSDEDAVKRLFKPTDRPTLKDAEKAVRKQKCLEYLQEKAEAEEDPEGPLHELLASEDQEAIGAAAAKYMSKFEYIDRSETLAQQATMEEEADAADAEQTSSLETANQQTKEALDSLAEALEAALVPCFNIQASLRPGQLQREIRSALEPWLSRRTSLFARAVPVEPAEAAAMLAEGSCTLSRFGRTIPCCTSPRTARCSRRRFCPPPRASRRRRSHRTRSSSTRRRRSRRSTPPTPRRRPPRRAPSCRRCALRS